MTRVVNRRVESGTPITHGTIFANPIMLGAACIVCRAVHMRERDDVAALLCYCRYFGSRLRHDHAFRARVQALESAPALECVCAPAPCHGDAIAAYVEAYSERVGIICGGDEPTADQREIAHVSGMNGLRQHVASLKDAQRS